MIWYDDYKLYQLQSLAASTRKSGKVSFQKWRKASETISAVPHPEQIDPTLMRHRLSLTAFMVSFTRPRISSKRSWVKASKTKSPTWANKDRGSTTGGKEWKGTISNP